MKASFFYGIAATLMSAVAVFAAPAAPESSGATAFYITAPVEGVTYTKGEDATIKWSNGIRGLFKIDVLTGEDAATMQSTGVTLTAEGSTGVYKWTVPEDLQDGTYAFVFQHSKGESYSSQFKIVSSTGDKMSSTTSSGAKSSTGNRLPVDTNDIILLPDTKDSTTKAVAGNALSTTAKDTTTVGGANTPAKAATGSTMETVNRATDDKAAEVGKKSMTGSTVPAGAKADVQTDSRSTA